MAAYDRALRALIAPGDLVLDAGAGTAILAMLAVRAGAGRAIAVESMPIAALASALVSHNGLDDSVEVIRADLRTLPPQAPIDLIVSDCLGRFLLDDHMLPAMDAAFRWLKPGGKVIPSKVELLVAPVALPIGAVPVLDTFRHPTLGLDLTPAMGLATHASWGIKLSPETLLAPPETLGTWHLPGPPPPWSRALSFTLTRTPEVPLRGLAGWFRAELAPGVLLETAPGVETHWHQLLMPLPATQVRAGDRLQVAVSLEATEPEPRWRRKGVVVTAAGSHPFDLGGAFPSSGQSLGPTAEAPALDAEGLNTLGATAWEAHDFDGARRYFEAAVTALAPHEDFPGLWENLGLARLAVGAPEAAILPFLRALDGAPASREQSARMLVDACFQSGRHLDGARFLAVYEQAFGPHPAGWRPISAEE